MQFFIWENIYFKSYGTIPINNLIITKSFIHTTCSHKNIKNGQYKCDDLINYSLFENENILFLFWVLLFYEVYNCWNWWEFELLFSFAFKLMRIWVIVSFCSNERQCAIEIMFFSFQVFDLKFFCLKLKQLKSTFKLTKDCPLICVWLKFLLFNNKKVNYIFFSS